MLHNNHFLNQELVQDPVTWDKSLKLSFKKMPDEVYQKNDIVCQKMFKQWMCAFHARPCTLTGLKPTQLCLDFCTG